MTHLKDFAKSAKITVRHYCTLSLVSWFISLLCLLSGTAHAQRVRVGAEVLMERYLDTLRGKRVAVVCNLTSVFSNGTHLVDSLLHRGIEITMLLAPEHGIRGQTAAGMKVENQVDKKTGLPVHSLYGGTRKPNSSVLANVDVIVFDLQDVGARFYTYASTMAYVMEAAAENGKKFIVLDRPNPINGVSIEGPVLDLRLLSFISLFPIPVRHGMTIGELAKMIAGEGYINPSTVDLLVVPMGGWRRTMWYDQTGLPWIAPSPNMKTLATATVYPGMCLFEATNLSEGRGTGKPFQYIGAPGLRSDILSTNLNNLKLPGVRFKDVAFTPVPDSVAAPDPKFSQKTCRGIFVDVTDRRTFQPVLTGVLMMNTLHRLYPQKFKIKQGLLDRYLGDESVSAAIVRGNASKGIFNQFKNDLDRYMKVRKKYLLY